MIINLFLSLYLLQTVLNLGLNFLNIKTLKFSAEIADENSGLAQAISYQRSKLQFAIFSLSCSALVSIIFLKLGGLGLLDAYINALGLPRSLVSSAYILALLLLSQLIVIPFDIYRQFVIEERFNFNKMTLKSYFIDQLKTLLLAVIILPILLWTLTKIMLLGSLWWLLAFVFIALIQFLLTWLFPVLISPLFNKFVPLEDMELKTNLEELLKENKFKIKGLYQVDGSKRSTHSNAYFTGFANSRRIVLYDTLIRQLSYKELEAVLLHEIGHYKKGHIVQGLLISMLSLLLFFFLLSLLMTWTEFFMAFGFTDISPHAILVLGFLSISLLSFFISPIINKLSRTNEFSADKFAVQALKESFPLISALRVLHNENFSHPNPHWLYALFNYSHPVLEERIKALKEQR